MNIKKRILNIIFYIIIIVVICVTLSINKDYSVLRNRYVIKDRSTYNKYNNYKFVTLDLSNSVETRFSINDNDKIKSTLYIVTYEDVDLLIELIPSTVTTNKVNLIYLDDNDSINLLKGDISKESNGKYDFVKGYYTNYNLKKNEDFIKYKMIVSKIILIICIIFIIKNFIQLVFLYNKKDY